MDRLQLEAEMKKVSEKWNSLKKDWEAASAEERLADQVRKFGHYKFKSYIGYGGGLEDERHPITLEDIKKAKMNAGIPEVTYYGGMSGDSGAAFLLDDADHARVKKIFEAFKLFFEVQASGMNPKDREKPESDARRAQAQEKLYQMLK